MSILPFQNKVVSFPLSTKASLSTAPQTALSTEERLPSEVEHTSASPSSSTKSDGRWIGKCRPNVLILGLAASLTGAAGIFSGCNTILAVGFGEALLIQGLVAMAYVILICSLAEVVSTTSFCGGAYGMTRVVLGFYPGFLVAMFEMMEYTMFSSLEVQFTVGILISEFNLDPSYQIWLIFLMYVFCAIFVLERNSLWWGFMALLGVFNIVVLIMYCVGSASHANFQENASLQLNTENKSASSNWFYGDMKTLLGVLPFCIWGFAGVESTSFMTDLVEEPRKKIPKALKLGVAILVVFVFAVLFVESSLSPGLSNIFSDDDGNLAFTYYPLTAGFSAMGISTNTITWLTFCGVFGCVIFCIFPAAKLIEQMMGSGLLPSNPFAKNQFNSAAVASLIISFLITVVSIQQPLFNIIYLSLACCLLTYLHVLYAFIRLRLDYSCMERESFSPFGVAGAIYAWLVFALTWVGCVFYSELPDLVYILLGMVGGFSVYYFGYVRFHEGFSEAEQKGLLVFHIIKFNQKKRCAIAHKGRRNLFSTFSNRIKPLPIRGLEQELANQGSVMCSNQNIGGEY